MALSRIKTLKVYADGLFILAVLCCSTALAQVPDTAGGLVKSLSDLVLKTYEKEIAPFNIARVSKAVEEPVVSRTPLSRLTNQFAGTVKHNFAGQDPDTQPAPAAAQGSAQDLAQQLANPVASLISVPFQNNFEFNAGSRGDGQRFLMNFQPVIPFSLNDKWNLITRNILPVIGKGDFFPATATHSGWAI